MSYQIKYNPEFSKRYPTKQKQKRSPLPYIVSIAAVVLIYIVLQTNILSALFSEEKAGTTAALTGLVENVESGVSIRESLLTFCRKIITIGA